MLPARGGESSALGYAAAMNALDWIVVALASSLPAYLVVSVIVAIVHDRRGPRRRR